MELLKIKNKKKVKSKLNDFYNTLINPCERLLRDNQIKTITVIPESYLFQIPFESLIDNEGKYLIENYNINYTSSFSMLASNAKSVKMDNKVLAIGNPQYERDTNSYVDLSDKELSRQVKASF